MIKCPNCGSTMNEESPCPECDHEDGALDCECRTCAEDLEIMAQQAELESFVRDNKDAS